MKKLILGALVTFSFSHLLFFPKFAYAQHFPGQGVDANQLLDKSRSIQNLIEQRLWSLTPQQRNRINQLLTEVNTAIISSTPGTGGSYPPPGGGGGYPPPGGGGGYPPPYASIRFTDLALAGIKNVNDAQSSVRALYGAMEQVHDPFLEQLKMMCEPMPFSSDEKDCLVRGLRNIGTISLDQPQATRLLRSMCDPLSFSSDELSCLKNALGVINSQQGQFVLNSCGSAFDAQSQVSCIYRGLMI